MSLDSSKNNAIAEEYIKILSQFTDQIMLGEVIADEKGMTISYQKTISLRIHFDFDENGEVTKIENLSLEPQATIDENFNRM
ncbi:MAG: hypothetical protein J7525_19655 [Roseofilum sp. SID3]|uniref:hypothetical protein n=1 Tax=Roseofilum sp. SID3 TaxID=2821499 RepID=UPI001B19B6C2|nr:hypothetical protein [Roseofilum sp. SID3]MBP0015312.1 hypothetical protein [Roseofilum sp. SID3]